jgi:hypothetical protein
MNIKCIEIDGPEQTIRIEAIRKGWEPGARVLAGGQSVCEVAASEDRDSRWAKACTVAALVYGRDKKNRPAATNSMINDVLTEIERIAGC